MKRPIQHATRNTRNPSHKNIFDDYPTPPWGTRALIEYALKPLGLDPPSLRAWTVWECAANRGFMQRPLSEYFGRTLASDITDYGCSNLDCLYDFLSRHAPPAPLNAALSTFSANAAENKLAIITNPPFIKGEEFVRRAFQYPARLIAVFARTNFLESESRYNAIYRATPPIAVASFAKRIPLFSGRIEPNGSTATSYAWFIWDRAASVKNPLHLWIPPEARERLEKPNDYRIDAAPAPPKEMELFIS